MSNEMGAPVRMQCVDRKPKRRGRPSKRLADEVGEQLAGLLPEDALQDALRGFDARRDHGSGRADHPARGPGDRGRAGRPS